MFGIKESELDDAINNSLLRADMKSFCEKQKIKKEFSGGGVDDPEVLQREKERIIRSQLNSADGEAVDLHDQVK